MGSNGESGGTRLTPADGFEWSIGWREGEERAPRRGDQREPGGDSVI